MFAMRSMLAVYEENKDVDLLCGDCSFQEVIPDLMRIAGYSRDEKLALLGKIVTRGMQQGLSTPGIMYDYAKPGIQCEGFMTSVWLIQNTVNFLVRRQRIRVMITIPVMV